MIIDTVTVTTTPQLLSALSSKLAVTPKPVINQLLLQADSGNAGSVIWIGNSDVAAGSKGWPLSAAKELQIWSNEESSDIQPHLLYVVASAGTPKLNFIAQES